MKRILVLLSILASAQFMTAQVMLPRKTDTNQLISLNGVWKFKYIPSFKTGSDSVFYKTGFNYSLWSNITTPGHWDLQGFAEPRYGTVAPGTGLYRTTFNVPASWEKQPVYIAFDGVLYGYDVWVNGHYAGSFASSYNCQVFDITAFVETGTVNMLAVKVSTGTKGMDFDLNDCWGISGIFRDVTLFSLPATHIKDIVIKTYVDVAKNGTLSIKALLEKEKRQVVRDLRITGTLSDPNGKMLQPIDMVASFRADTASFQTSIRLEKPNLWTAETPSLYTLTLVLQEKGKVLQTTTHNVGIRQISTDNGILKLNNTPIKLRGVNHHNLVPETGRVLTEADMLRDLRMIKDANMNYIRTSHYPPHPRLIELCDSMGIYVMCEVPFGYGDSHLNDSTYLPILLDRARATVWRDKNHASVIVWSVGNENPVTRFTNLTAAYVKQLDETRPICYPQIGSYFRNNHQKIPDFMDILAPHYPVPSVLREYSDKFNKPMIVSEYAHALGLDFDRMEELWEIMYQSPKIAGGSVWHFFDQGILRTAKEKVDVNAFTTSVWQDSVTYYDNAGNQGADGLVYANRAPQTDYWQVRKVYTPVKPLDDTLAITPGKQSIRLRFNNRFDFYDLSGVECQWQVVGDTMLIQKGSFALVCAPHDTVVSTIALDAPANLTASYYFLKLNLLDKESHAFYEKTYRLQNKNISGVSAKMLAQSPQTATSPGTGRPFSTKGNFKVNSGTGMISLGLTNKTPLIIDGPFARVGRKTTMSEKATSEKQSSGNGVWLPHLIKNPTAALLQPTLGTIRVNYKYERPGQSDQYLEGYVNYAVNDSGWMDVSYQLTPINATGIFLETGISFLLPSSLTEFRWIGMGPYPAYPGKDRLDEFGVYHLNSGDINYQGNRSKTDLAVLSDAKGNGIAILTKSGNVAVERAPEGLIVTINSQVSGRYNKGSLPEYKIKADETKVISGTFKLIPLTAQWPETLTKLFGNPNKTAVPFKPFYHSYDQ